MRLDEWPDRFGMRSDPHGEGTSRIDTGRAANRAEGPRAHVLDIVGSAP
jgi:hypothetical protein